MKIFKTLFEYLVVVLVGGCVVFILLCSGCGGIW